MASGCLEHYSQLRCLDPAASCPWGGPFVVTETHCDSIKAAGAQLMSFQASASRSLQAVVSSAFVLFIVSFAIGSLSSVSLILTWFSLLFLLLCFPYAARGTAAYPNPAAIQGDDGG